MMSLKPYLLLCFLAIISCANEPKNTEKEVINKEKKTMPQPTPTPQNKISIITFPSKDGLEITADLYHTKEDAPVFVLCHQARFNRSAYKETAKKLMERGINCLATDQRSGGVLNEQANETTERAKAKGLPTSYLDAEQDINAAVDFMAQKYNQQVILVGSSYSAALGLKVAKENPNVKAILSFSPGEYFGTKLTIAEAIDGLNKPTFITSSKKEAPQAKKLAAKVVPDKVVHFVPQAEGIHGAKALWSEHAFSDEYWTAVDTFLAQYELF
jgi:dienelactone hydrolase